MFNRAEIKQQGKLAFKANYWLCVVGGLITGFCAGGSSVGSFNSVNNSKNEDGQSVMQQIQTQTGLTQEQTTALILGIFSAVAVIGIIGFLVRLFVLSPLNIGCKYFFKNNVESPEQLGAVGRGYKESYMRNVLALFLKDLFIALWSLLFIIPGIVKSYSYRMVPYILADRPELSATEAITESRKMMDGHKMDMFVFDLSFLGWHILSALTFGILGIFYVMPYLYSSDAAAYRQFATEAGYQISSTPSMPQQNFQNPQNF